MWPFLSWRSGYWPKKLSMLSKIFAGASIIMIINLCGDPGRIRTYDARLRTAALYPLSYRAFAIYSNSLDCFGYNIRMSEKRAEDQPKPDKKNFKEQFDDEDTLLVFRKHPIVMRKGLILAAFGMLVGPLYTLVLTYLQKQPSQFELLFR